MPKAGGVVQFVGLALVLVLGVGLAVSAAVSAPARHAVWVSATLAFVVQVVAFLVARAFAKTHAMAGWGLGVILRLLAVAFYGILVAMLWRSLVAPALLTFAGLLFATTVVEPLFLDR
jgi:hypothetical protein